MLLLLHLIYVSCGYQLSLPHLPHILSEPSLLSIGLLLLLLAVELSDQGKIPNHYELNVFICKIKC